MQWGYLQIGDIIDVTATRLGLEAHPAMVVGKRWAQTVWGFYDPISNKPEFGITMIVFIDRQHAANQTNWPIRVQAVDIDGDATPEREAIITGQISIPKLEKILMLLGVDVMPISDGTYSERHARVNEYAAMYPNRKTVYLAMHLNAGGGMYAAFFYHHASTQGHELAKQLCLEMRAAGFVKSAKPIECKPNNWTKNAFYTIRGLAARLPFAANRCLWINPNTQNI